MSNMSYWIIMILLAAGCAGMLAGSFISIKKRNAANAASRRKGRRQANYSGDEEEQYDTARRKAVRRPEQGQNQDSQAPRPQRKKKRQWKIILENIDSWEKYSFVFYDVVGIGRAREGKMYEKYLPLTEDKRISKAHCVIMRRGDRSGLPSRFRSLHLHLQRLFLSRPESGAPVPQKKLPPALSEGTLLSSGFSEL